MLKIVFLKTGLLTLLIFLFFDIAHSANLNATGNIGIHLRSYPQDSPIPGRANDNIDVSAHLEAEIFAASSDKQHRFFLQPFTRSGSVSSERNHTDFREANYRYLSESYDFTIGIGKVFWGVTESHHLVDIINQVDTVEDLDGEDKLGQPMINFNWYSEAGDFGFYLLPGFRERPIDEYQRRLSTLIPIQKNSLYTDGAAKNHIDYALRYQNTIQNFDFGIAYFYGVSRAPTLVLTGASLRPKYTLIDRASVDIQFTGEDWLLKLESISEGGHGRRIFATVTGLERTIYGIFNNHDLGLLAEYQFDDRNIEYAPPVSTDNDLFLALRYGLNDQYDSAILIGGIVDLNDETTVFTIEAERRFSDSWFLEFSVRAFCNVSETQGFYAVRHDDFFSLTLDRYF